MKDKETVRKWLDNSLTEEERAAFEQTEDYHFVNKLSDALKHFKAPDYSSEKELGRLKANMPQQKEVRMTPLWKRPVVQAAAVLLVLAGLSYYFFAINPFEADRQIISAAEQEEVVLPDASLVKLNAHTTISFIPENWEQNRNVQLNGEAYFVVENGGKFDVITESGKVSVLGTRFNVKQRQNYFEVTCYEGRVAITTSFTDEIILSPGQQYRIMNGEVVESEVVGVASPSWTENISTFASVPIAEVLREFERQFNVKVRYEKLDTNRLFSGSFTHQNQTVALKSIMIPLGLEYRTDQGEIILIE